ncbi:MAG: dephospho-CoA kinase [bacterium]|nr:dephospho-CoA kinase [bacterium]
MQRIAITGGVAEGKTTILRMFEALGAHTLSSDAIVATLTRPGTELCRQLIKEFGPSIVAADGTLARGALAQQAFSEPRLRRRLNQLIHPAVMRALRAQLDALETASLVVVEVPLLIEAALQGAFDGVIVAQATPALQRQRLLQRGVSWQQAQRILRAQLPTRAKTAFADWTVRTHRTLEQVEAQVRRIWQELTEPRGVYSSAQRIRR